ncbi:uncharacterized protein MEPE_00862 [Melanopsichium pennsylvanicum]|uniref:VHS domain-containing protein n=2 Tax=Melanopsichium pennsylvanicum TaxID=63383 RepID=A0AAJ5C325_9BASI|nr:conserved hypothetical protein [Melanopsichium pennsylvanicum 4]SNX82156.1 uncharacterized protein MEPE_00862 [Melanopsichium pennsylvanicum]
MKKFFKPKEAGNITPLPPTTSSAASSSFATPRPFAEYQARVAAAESTRPLSFQPPSASSPSIHLSSDEHGDYVHHPHSQSQRQSQLFSPSHHRSPNKNRFSNHIHHTQEPAYESYSDPLSAQTQSHRPTYDRSNTSDHHTRFSQAQQPQPQRHSYQHPPSAFEPPPSLRPAQSSHSSRHQHHSISASPASVNGFQNASNHLKHLHLPNSNHASIDGAWHSPHPISRHSDDSEFEDQDDERTPTVSGAARSFAYPVYSGGDAENQSGGEVLISQARYEETVLSEPSIKDKAKGNKLFSFGTKDKKSRQQQDRDTRTAASSPIPASRIIRDHNHPRIMSPSTDAHQLPPAERNREAGWMEKFQKRAHNHQASRLHDKEIEQLVSSNIDYLTSTASNETEWMQIYPLLDLLSSPSDAAAKEASRCLRKEFKYGTVDTQRRAVRIWALLTLNSSHRFRYHVASRKFLETIEDTIASSKTPLSVKETMLRVLGVLAYEFKGDAELGAVTKSWNKVKPNDRMKHGEPLVEELWEFRLPQASNARIEQHEAVGTRVSQPHSQAPRREPAAGGMYTDMVAPSGPHSSATFASPPHQPAAPLQQQQIYSRQVYPPTDADAQPRFNATPSEQQQRPTDVVSQLEAAAANMTMPPHSPSYQSSHASDNPAPISFSEDVRRLHEECTLARNHSSVLLDTLLHHGLHPETQDLILEFYDKVLGSQELIASQIPWASAQADRAQVANGEEEALLADLLDAHGRCGEVIREADEARRRLQEEQEERRVIERSQVEVRLDRSALAQDSSGELYDLEHGSRAQLLGVGENQASGSRSASPAGYAALPSSTTQGVALVPSPGSNLSATSAGSNGVTSPNINTTTARVSRPLPVPKDNSNSADSNSTRSFHHPSSHPNHHHQHQHQYAVTNSLSASVHSMSGSTTSAHSRDASISTSSSQYGAGPNSNAYNAANVSAAPVAATGGRSLPLTPNLNIDIKGQASGLGGRHDVVLDDEQEKGEGIQTPIVPSEKALGKRRAVSVRYPSPPPSLGQIGNGQAPPPQLLPHPYRKEQQQQIIDSVNGLKIAE